MAVSKAAPGVDKDNLIQAAEEDLTDEQKGAIANYMEHFRQSILTNIKKDRRGKVVMPEKINMPAFTLRGGLVETTPSVSTSSPPTLTSASCDDLDAGGKSVIVTGEAPNFVGTCGGTQNRASASTTVLTTDPLSGALPGQSGSIGHPLAGTMTVILNTPPPPAVIPPPAPSSCSAGIGQSTAPPSTMSYVPNASSVIITSDAFGNVYHVLVGGQYYTSANIAALGKLFR